MSDDADLIFVGGGLANGLIAWRLRQQRPDVRLLVLEAGATLGGNHTWSFHGADLSPRQVAWIAPLVEHSWNQYEVRFPSFRRVVELPYHAIASPTLHARLTDRLGDRVLLGASVTSLDAASITLADGRRLTARVVLDGRGFDREADRRRTAWQVFFGLELALDHPHGLVRPIVLDACVAQPEEFRFFYVLPRTPRLLLVEDVRYANAPQLPHDGPALVEAYARTQGWWPAHVVRRELGVMPVPFHPARPPPLAIGLRGGLFHPTTGYSTPFAIHVAEAIADTERIDPDSLAETLSKTRRRLLPDQRFFHFVNRVFIAAEPPAQARVFRRFYERTEDGIAHFHTARLTSAEKLELLATRPPASVPRAARSIFG